MCLHHQLLPCWYDLGQLPMQEQLNQMQWRYLRIQQHLHHPFKQMPIRFGLEQQQRLHTNQQRLPIRIILQRSQVRPIHFMRQRKSLERYSQSMRLPTRHILQRCLLRSMRHWSTLCQWRLLLPRRNFLRWNSMRCQICRQMHQHPQLELERNSLCLFPRILNQRRFMFLQWSDHW